MEQEFIQLSNKSHTREDVLNLLTPQEMCGSYLVMASLTEDFFYISCSSHSSKLLKLI